VGLAGGRYLKSSLRDRFEARITRLGADECWPFSGARTGNNGYLQIARENGSRVYAHRLAWEFVNGPVPDGLRILHRCDNPVCVNPKHLWLGTQRENVEDSIHKGRFNAFGRQRLDAAKVREIRRLGARGLRHKDIAARFGVKRHTISGILSGQTWQHLDPFVLGAGVSADFRQRLLQPLPSPAQQPDRRLNLPRQLAQLFEVVPSVQLEIRGEVG